MKIISVLRTLNEERFIARHCKNHQFADKILIADGGSTDRTVALAADFENVRIRHFKGRKYLEDRSFMNPEPAHANFLIRWAEAEGADWIIFSDCDKWPHPKLQEKLSKLFIIAGLGGYQGIMALQLYLWGNSHYFPKINEAGPSIWAWKASLKLRCSESSDTFFDAVMPGPDPEKCYKLDLPYCLLHYFSDQKREEEKMLRYALWGHPKTHILESIYAPPEKLPRWVFEEKD